MRVAGFTAENSLFPTNMRYRAANFYRGYGQSSVILPARVVCGDCGCDTYDFGAPGVCVKLCVNYEPGVYPYPYPVPCRANECNPPCDQPTCGPCTQTCAYPGGSSFTRSC
jgi:hypothetical protein